MQRFILLSMQQMQQKPIWLRNVRFLRRHWSVLNSSRL